MHIEQSHNLGKDEAIRRINTFIEEMMVKELPAGVKVTDFSKSWSDNTLRFSLTAKKGFFGATIKGVVLVADQLLTMDAELPGILTAFMSEDKIRSDVQAQFTRVFSS